MCLLGELLFPRMVLMGELLAPRILKVRGAPSSLASLISFRTSYCPLLGDCTVCICLWYRSGLFLLFLSTTPLLDNSCIPNQNRIDHLCFGYFSSSTIFRIASLFLTFVSYFIFSDFERSPGSYYFYLH